MAAAVKSYDFLNPPSQSGDMGMLGHYRVIDELGKGGMGFVFRAEDVKLKRSVALKVMNQKIAATPFSRRRFIHEARAMAAVHHDNVVTIFEVGESNKTPFMAMEMLKGSTLETFNKSETRLGYEEIIEYARQIARGLSAAHVKGIVHRDIKPANIWIEKETNRIKILDFGLALASTPVDHLAGRGAVIGTPGYLSPEQARSEPLDDRSDLYSMGVVLYELCTGQLPIQAKSVPGQLISILAHRPTPVNELNPDIPQPLCDLIHRMLRKEPRFRPSSAAKLVEELNRVEQDCHAKSEVAQAISKLQMGLSEVVSKSASESLFETVDEIEETIPDPLAAIPAPVTLTPPARPVAKSKPAAAAAPAWVSYWPIAAISAAVLIALPILTYAFSGKGRTDVAYVVSGDPSGSGSAIEAPGPAEGPSARDKPAQQTPAAQNNNQANAQKNPQKNKPGAGGANGRNQGNKNRKANPTNRDGRPAPGNPPAGTNRPGANKADSNKAGAVNANVATKMSESPTPPGDPKPPPDPAKTAPADADPPKPEAAEVEMLWTTITTRDGRGADAMVQSGSSQRLGNKPSIGIATRNDIETNHSYLRFDLAEIEQVKAHVKAAGIVLTLVGRDQPLGSVIRVHGIKDLGLWPELALEWRNSYSVQGLDSLPLLGEATITQDNIAHEDGRLEVRIADARFAKFIVESSTDTVTMVLAGSGAESELLRFVSRESQTDRPPKLLVQIPKNAPPDTKDSEEGNRGSRGNRR